MGRWKEHVEEPLHRTLSDENEVGEHLQLRIQDAVHEANGVLLSRKISRTEHGVLRKLQEVLRNGKRRSRSQ
jgi:hypothetical protein